MTRTVEDFIGETPLARLQRLPGPENDRAGNTLLAKLEGNNPAGSVKDRPAMSMVRRAEERGTIRKGDTVIVYHTGDEKQAVGLAVAASDAYPDPKLKDPKVPVVDLAADRALPEPVTLALAGIGLGISLQRHHAPNDSRLEVHHAIGVGEVFR